jgi:hypothetical protein
MMTDDDLDSFFAAARDTAPAPSEALISRVLTDASLEQSRPEPMPARAPNRSIWQILAAVFGGGGALAGMVTATVAGAYIGFSQPLGEGIFALVTGAESTTIDMMPGIDALLEEAP